MNREKRKLMVMALLLSSLAFTLFALAETIKTQVASSPSATNYDATVATDWFSLSLELVQETKGFSPPVASRAFGYMGVTLYEAIVPGMKGYKSLVGQLNGLTSVPQPEAEQTYDWSVVANSAIAEMTKKLFANASEESEVKMEQLEQDFISASSPEVIERSEAYGRAVAEAIYAWSLEDGSQAQLDYVVSNEAGMWQPTAPKFTNALLPQWGNNRPFVLETGDECAIAPALAYSEEKDSAFYKEGLEVYETSQALTDEQREIASFWSDDPGKTATPPGHWLSILTQLLVERNDRLDSATEAYANLGIAVADSFIGCWNAKYEYNLLRPITYIQTVTDPSWQPLLNTPPFPEYTSGHSVQSAAAAVVLTDLFGEDFTFTDHTHDGHGLQARSFTSFSQAAEEAAVSRLYGGIHFSAAIENGLAQGHCIGEKVLGIEFRQAESYKASDDE
jgi:PAP2 superfamily